MSSPNRRQELARDQSDVKPDNVWGMSSVVFPYGFCCDFCRRKDFFLLHPNQCSRVYFADEIGMEQISFGKKLIVGGPATYRMSCTKVRLLSSGAVDRL